MANPVNRSNTKKEIQSVQREWLSEVLSTTQRNPTQLAQGAGVNKSTLTRLLNDEDYSGTLTPETIQRIKDTYRVPGPEEYASSRRGPLIGFSEAARFDAKEAKADTARVVKAILDGRPGVDPWVLKTLALEGVGYLPGDIVFVEHTSAPKPQDAVCAQVTDYSRGSAETVWRVYDPPFLVGAANERTAYKPLLVDGSRVAIVGVIRESFRPHSLSASVR